MNEARCMAGMPDVPAQSTRMRRRSLIQEAAGLVSRCEKTVIAVRFPIADAHNLPSV